MSAAHVGERAVGEVVPQRRVALGGGEQVGGVAGGIERLQPDAGALEHGAAGPAAGGVRSRWSRRSSWPARRRRTPGANRGAERAGQARGRRPGAQRRIPRVHVIVLGIDPGVANTGYGIVAHDRGRLVALDGGVIETPAGAGPGAAPDARSTRRVGELMDDYQPDAVAVEDLYFGANARSAFAVGQARGVVILAAGQRRIRCASYTPQQVKAAVCGSGRAAKDQVQRMVQTLLSLPSSPSPTTPPTRSRSRSATPTARRCRPRWRRSRA